MIKALFTVLLIALSVTFVLYVIAIIKAIALEDDDD